MLSKLYYNNDGWKPLLDEIYPIGALYLSFNNTSPATLFGGSWTPVTACFLRASTDTNTGGADNITLTSNQIPSHYHGLNNHTHGVGTLSAAANGRHAHTIAFWMTDNEAYGYGLTIAPGFQNRVVVNGNTGASSVTEVAAHSHTLSGSTGGSSGNTTSTGGGKSFSNMPKYQNIYVWRRIK